MIEQRLEVVRMFQEMYDDCHVGGSIGLFLHGVDLRRDLSRSDVDLIVSTEIKQEPPIENLLQTSNPEDFDYQFNFHPKGMDRYFIKVDITIRPEKKYIIIIHEGRRYNVSRLEDILAWKHHYSMKGSGKHTNDLEAIRTGIRPKEEVVVSPATNLQEIDDLPF